MPQNLSLARLRMAGVLICLLLVAEFTHAGAPRPGLSEPSPQVSQLDGTYTFLADSDGANPPSCLQILLTFSRGNVVLVSDPPQQAYTDSGTYQFQAGVLQRLVLPRLGKFVSNGTVNLQNGVLTLPFKLLSGGAGYSDWKAPAANASGDSTLETLRKIAHKVRSRFDQVLDPGVKLQILASIGPGPERWQDFAQVGTDLSLAGQVEEASWTFAQGVELKPDDPYLLNNFGHILGLDYDYEDAHFVLLAARQLAPQNSYILANLGYTAYQLKHYDEAELAEQAAVAGNPIPENYWSLCKILAAKHDVRANEACQQAQALGIVGILQPGAGQASGDKGKGTQTAAGGESQPPQPDTPPGPDTTPPDNRPDLQAPASNEDQGAESAATVDPDASIYGQIGKRNPALDQKPPEPYHFPASQGEINQEWVGHWEGYKVTGCIHRARKFGQGLAMTLVHENICHYAQKLSLDVDKNGGISGKGEAVYVFYGKGDNPAMMMLPLPMPPGGFFCTFPGGYRVRKFEVQGQVEPDGSVFIGGRPEKEMYLLNVYEFQKIYGWNVFPPPEEHPGAPGELHISKQASRWAMIGERTNQVSGMRYETTIFRSEASFPMVKGCKIMCTEESGTKTKVKPKCEMSMKGPVQQSFDGEEVAFKVNQGTLKDDGTQDKGNSVSAGITVSPDGDVFGADLGVTAAGMTVSATAKANYGKNKGDLEKAIQAEKMAGCGGEGPKIGSIDFGIKAGTAGKGKVSAEMGWSATRNAISGDETFSFGGSASAKAETEEGTGSLSGTSAGGKLGAEGRLIISSKCGLITKFKVSAKASAKLDTSDSSEDKQHPEEAGGPGSAEAECFVSASVEKTQVWGQSNIAE